MHRRRTMMIDNRYAPPTARLDLAGESSMPAFWFVLTAFALELILFATTWRFGFPLSDPIATGFWIGTLGVWLVLVALAWATSRQYKIARTVLFWLLVLILLYLLLTLVAASTTVSQAPSRLVGRLVFGAGVHLLQFVLAAAAIWSLRRARSGAS